MKISPYDNHFPKELESYQLRQYTAGVNAAKQKRTVIDAGAHIGIFTTRYAREFERVVAIEPIPYNAQFLYDNTEHLDNVMIVMKGVSNEPTELYAHNPTPGNTGAWELTNNHSDIEVEICTIDSLNLTDVDLIKVDTQGLEQQVLEGAKHTIETYKPVIHIETRSQQLLDWIKKTYNYTKHTQVGKDHILVSK